MFDKPNQPNPSYFENPSQPIPFKTYGEGKAYLFGRGLKSWIACLGSARSHSSHETLSDGYNTAKVFAETYAEATVKSENLPGGIATGGGPGMMEAFNYGAKMRHLPSIAICIHLEGEAPNPYSDPVHRLKIENFEDRQKLLMEPASAIVAVDGGYGTTYELFDVLTKVHTGTWKERPILLIGEKFGAMIKTLVGGLVEIGTVSEDALQHFDVVRTAEEAVETLKERL